MILAGGEPIGMIDDIRKLLQDLITPDLKALQVTVSAADEASKARDLALEAEMDLKFQAVLAKMDANQAALLNAMNIEKRVEAIERQSTRPAA